MTDIDASADPFRSADKMHSWNDFGSLFWDQADATSHPSERETAGFLGKARQGSKVLIAGATTAEVIAAALARGAEVHVIDFADKLLARAKNRFGATLHVHLHDVTNPPSTELEGQFDIVVADRLINRFHRSEMPQVIRNLMAFVGFEGQLRVSIRFGLYPLDRKLIRRGKELGTLTKFWDEHTRTINWSEVTTEIDDVAENHGDIPAAIVADWSRMRGVESRILPGEIKHLAREASTAGKIIEFSSPVEMDVAIDSAIFVAVKKNDSF